MSIRDTIVSLQTGSYTCRRQGAPTAVMGEPVASTNITTFTFTASKQPVTGRDVDSLPEAVRTKELIKLFALSEVMPERPGFVADVVIVDGEDYDVATSFKWEAFGEVFWIVLAARRSQR